MNKIHLVSGINKNYLQAALPFIESINKKSSLVNTIITIDFDAKDDIKSKFSNVKFIKIDSSEIQAKNPNTCMQHGGFLPALNDISDDDIIIFTDADIIFQRDFSDKELNYISKFNEFGLIGVGYNEAPSQTLLEEGENLKQIASREVILQKFPDCDKLYVFNTGVVIAKKSTYKELYKLYIGLWSDIDLLFSHYAKQQWLLSYIIQKHLKYDLLPDEIHTHNHHPIKLRVKREFGIKFCIENTPVIFAHHILDETVLAKNTKHKTTKNKKIKKWKRIALMEGIVILLLILLNIMG